jgi:hypothetical protein
VVFTPIVLLYRTIHYRSLKYHYFLIDFCYYANLAGWPLPF